MLLGATTVFVTRYDDLLTDVLLRALPLSIYVVYRLYPLCTYYFVATHHSLTTLARLGYYIVSVDVGLSGYSVATQMLCNGELLTITYLTVYGLPTYFLLMNYPSLALALRTTY